ncbi:hypothetical protein Tco_1356090, partial [Tanacetum coccineum]
EFIQAIKNFFSDMANIKIPTRKPKHPVISYCRFTKLIIYYLGSRHNIHRRHQSHVHITDDDYLLNNLKFVNKGSLDEPKPLKKTTSKPTPSKKIHKEKRSDHLVDEKDNESQPATEPQVEDDEYNLQRGIQMSLESFQALVGGVAIRKPNSGITQRLSVIEGKGKGIISDEQAAQSLLDLQKPKKKSITDQYIFQRQTPATQDASTRSSTQPQDDTSANVVYDTLSPADSTSKADIEILNFDEEHGKEVSHTVDL